MNSTLPAALKAAMEALLEGVSRKELAARSAAITTSYRSGAGSTMAIANEADALAYLVARLPATYAVAAAALAQVRDAAPDFAPARLLDAGAGPGTATWATREVWPSLAKATLTDSNPRFLELARRLVPDAEILARNLALDALPTSDLVVASFVIAEVAQPRDVIARLYTATDDVLVLIEPGTPTAFARIRAARDQLLGQGAHVLAPCTHANECPIGVIAERRDGARDQDKMVSDWCHFSQRLPRSRDHLQTKRANVPFEDERYSWLAVSKTRRSAFDGRARVLGPPRETKPGIEFKLCTASGLEHRFVARRDKVAFAPLRKAAWGDVI
jgi:ribosomal protein RSM22 (predicted rRNA methylase)